MRTLALLALLACGGCAHHRLTSRELRTVRVFYAPPGQPYEVLGSISASDNDLGDALDDLKRQAVEMGGNAVLVTMHTQSGKGGVSATPGLLVARHRVENQLAADAILLK